MKETDIEAALQTRLAMANGATVVYENSPAIPERPFLFVEHVPTEQTDDTLAGGHKVSTGFMAVTIVIADGEFVTEARQIADQIEAVFPYGLKLAITGGTVTVNRPLQRLKGFQQASDYRMQVRVAYQATETPA